MNEDQEMKISRLAGANAISSSAIAFGEASGLTIEKCSWDIGEDLSHEHAHRLDLFTASKTVRLYFPDIELTRSEDIIRKKRIDTRLRSAIAQLIPHVPASTYTFRK
jgi:hypothetical protein